MFLRSMWDIMAKILEVAKSPEPKTHIMYRANLSFSQLERYIELLRDRGPLNVVEKRQSKVKEVFVITDKGFSFLEAHRALTEIGGKHSRRS
jgi:predicted transcriptional regulator